MLVVFFTVFCVYFVLFVCLFLRPIRRGGFGADFWTVSTVLNIARSNSQTEYRPLEGYQADFRKISAENLTLTSGGQR